MEKDNIQNSFNTTLVDSKLENLGIDISELAIDSVLQDGLLKDIPIVGTIINLSKFGANIHDRLFLKKLLSFLNKLESIPSEKRKELIQNIESSKKYRMKVGEKLLYIIDTCEDYEISELVGLLFKAFTEEKVSYDDFLKGSSVLKKLNMSDFKWFIKERKSHYFDLDDVGDLISSGLFELHYEQVSVQVEDETDHKQLMEGGKKYKSDVDGGVSVYLSRAGEVILEIFCPSYIKPKTIKI
jgi:hypothetical protein